MSPAAFRWTALALVAALGGAAAMAFRPTEERRVRQRLEALAEALTAPPREAEMARLGRVSGVRGYLTEDVTVHLAGQAEPLLRGRDAIVGTLARGWMPASGIRVELQDIQTKVDESRTMADVRLKARVISTDTDSNGSTVDARTVALTMHRTDGTWRISSARIMESDDAIR